MQETNKKYNKINDENKKRERRRVGVNVQSVPVLLKQVYQKVAFFFVCPNSINKCN